MEKELVGIYQSLLSCFGKQDWWPAGRNFSPFQWEVVLGAILTQNTNWKNVEKALDNLKGKNITNLKSLLKTEKSKLKELIKPSGYYNQKAGRLKEVAGFVSEEFGTVEDFLENVTREQLLKLKGIGPETADSILLYACGRPEFVIDAYTRRIFGRLNLIEEDWGYRKIKSYFQAHLPKDTRLYKEFHALLVELAKRYCKKEPACGECPLKEICNFG